MEMAVLVAVSIPIFTTQLEKSREATDIANLRAAKAAVVAAYLTEDTTDLTTAKWGEEAVSFQYDALNVKLVTSGGTKMKGTSNNPGTYTADNNEYKYVSGTSYTDKVYGGSIAVDGTITWAI